MNQRTFLIDWDNLEEVRRFFNQSKSRYFELNRIETQTPSRKERGARTLDACRIIWETDISSIYDMPLDTTPKYYVYAHLDTGHKIAVGYSGKTTFAAMLGMTHFPFYIGKGTGERCNDLNRSETHHKVRQRLKTFGKEIIVFKIGEGLSEAQALQAESKLIDIFGLLPHGGMLCNLDEGHEAVKRRDLYSTAYEEISSLFKEARKQVTLV
jgi:hypothetical protein